MLMRREKPTRSMSKADLTREISNPDVYRDFLKLCMEHDDSKDLHFFRKGLLAVIKSVGITRLAEQTGLSRLGLYRMLSRPGNPRLGSLLTLFGALGIRMWLVDEEFILKRQKVVRPKDVLAMRPVTRRSGNLGAHRAPDRPSPKVIIRRPARQD